MGVAATRPPADLFDGAACRADDVPSEWFWPEGKNQATRAKEVCRRCPVDHAACEAFGNDFSPKWGVYGGFTPAERANRKAAA